MLSGEAKEDRALRSRGDAIVEARGGERRTNEEAQRQPLETPCRTL
jgi:hypothetical protein